MDMKKCIVLVGLLLQVMMVAAQVQLDYRSGYVVLANKDTLYGEIGQLPTNSKIAKVHFREKGARVDKLYSAFDLLSYNFWPDVTYESMELPTYRQKDTIYTWHFALRRLSGAIKLLKLNSTSGEDRFFVQNQKYGLSELKNPIETINNQVFRDNRYMSVLAKYTNDVPDFQSRIAAYGYDEENLVALISEYNVHFGENKGYKPYFDWNPSLYVSAGSIVNLLVSGLNL